ncbi:MULTISPECIES: hypothetical protein [Streptomyces]|uniref:Uncharacterized protein n=2 Tax=Streptomyces TaxID=1883 RepID=A0A2U9PAL3_STRAS|nr:hypothetical protein [Streptomyces actuosus]AWT46141.1 hypothetical protein DMT42_30160 [Streptomyces actuosus]MBM4822807.1 hypothetical protein [Streptomyces actuosus]
MNLTKRTAVLLALAALTATLTALAVAGPAQAAAHHDPSHRHAAAADPVDEPEDVELDEAGRPDLTED